MKRQSPAVLLSSADSPGGRGLVRPPPREPGPELSTPTGQEFPEWSSQGLPSPKQWVNSATQIQAATKQKAGKGLGPALGQSRTPPRQPGEPYLRPPPAGPSNLGNVRCHKAGAGAGDGTLARLRRADLPRLPHRLAAPALGLGGPPGERGGGCRGRTGSHLRSSEALHRPHGTYGMPGVYSLLPSDNTL